MRTDRVSVLVALCALASLVVLARLYQVQIHEHPVWADEAARLLHRGELIPARRGRILDTKGRVLARDKETHNLHLVYRDFRREHVLGEIAHARSLLEGRPVSLRDASYHLRDWAWEFVHLTADDLSRFAKGEALSTASFEGHAVEEPREENRPRRAKDLAFYIRSLFDLDKRVRVRLEKRARDEDAKDVPFLELAAALPDAPAPDAEALWQRLDGRLERSMVRLSNLAVLLDWPEPEPGAPNRSPLERLIDELEDTRRWVEDATAAKLFREATGFVPGRIEPRVLRDRIDLTWIGRLLVWDDARLDEWARTTRDGWLRGWRDEYALSRMLVQLTLEPGRTPMPDDVLERVAAVFAPVTPRSGEKGAVARVLEGEPFDWTRMDQLAVVTGIDDVFEATRPRELRDVAGILPIQSPRFAELHAALAAEHAERLATIGEKRALANALEDEKRREQRLKEVREVEETYDAHYWRLVDAAWSPEAVATFDAAAPVERALDPRRPATSEPAADELPGVTMQRLLASAKWDAPDRMLELVSELVDEWDAAFQAAVVDALDELIASARPDQLSADRKLILAEELRDHASERVEFFLKDYGRRPRLLMRGEPSYEVIYLLSRYDEDYAGLVAQQATEREYLVVDGDTERFAEGLVGNVSAIGVEDVVSQSGSYRKLAALKAQPSKTDEERRELESLVGEVLLYDEVKGVAGVEGYWNEELAGTNGFEERFGLEDVLGKNRDEREVIEPVNGRDVVLTLDADLQRAARRTLTSSAGTEDDRYDDAWYREPVGAIVLLSKDGDVLAAESEPNASSTITEGSRMQRTLRLERTLRRPTFQPPGSVFKVFVAAWALSEINFDPNTIVSCESIGAGAGYKDVHCSRTYGHHDIALHDAIAGSCNAYFAFLGEVLADGDLRDVAHTFGFDQPVGVRTPPPWDDGFDERSGLLEDVGGIRDERFGKLGPHERRLAGNGLGLVEATPMQLARATLGLATGELRDLRLVRRIGDQDLPPGDARPLGLRRGALDFVRSAMMGVTDASSDLATGKALDEANFGFRVAAKTGSADYAARKVWFRGKEVVPKHTWIAGWAPAEDPEIVFAVFVHDTLATSSHGAVYLAREILRQPEVLAYLADRGVDVSGVPAR